MSETNLSGIGALVGNLKDIKTSFLGSFMRHDLPISDRGRSSIFSNNFFLHIMGSRVHINTLRPTYTLGLGLIALFLLLITFVSGVVLMVYYHPSVDNAYNSIKDINSVISGGRLFRNVHKWAGEGMIIFVLLHMARVFYTNSYKKGREFNWLIGLLLLVLTFVLNFTGYLLPWDQLSYWALVIGANIAQAPKEITDILGLTSYFDIGGLQKELFLGGLNPGKETLIRVYFLHIMLLPLALSILVSVHFWRIRKDGGMTTPENFQLKTGEKKYLAKTGAATEVPASKKTYGLMTLGWQATPALDKDHENTVMSWPHLLRAEVAVFMLCLAVVIVYSYFVNAPLKELANPLIPENPAKAPWYFLGLQEMVSYSAFMGGMALPTVAILSLALVPYLDREHKGFGIWFTDRQGIVVTLLSVLVGAVILVGLLAFVVSFGWLRNWWPEIPQVIITLINPGTLWVGFVAAWSILITRITGSTRQGAIAMFSLFLLSFIIFTYMGTELRGPNWEFYWSKDQWPAH
jgi:quinol-cytochrome oxidoreductase complex cytochrome b subunit